MVYHLRLMPQNMPPSHTDWNLLATCPGCSLLRGHRSQKVWTSSYAFSAMYQSTLTSAEFMSYSGMPVTQAVLESAAPLWRR